MGSRFASLDLPEHLRPWLEQGVRFLYREEGWPAPKPTRQARQQASQQRPAPQARQAERPAPGGQPTQAKAGPDSARKSPDPQPSANRSGSPSMQAYLQGIRTDANQPWPAPWDTYLQRLNPNARVVFTYFELCRDLGGEPNRERGDIWRRLLTKLAWPKGFSTFWPVSQPRADSPASQPTAKPALFWRGASRTNVHTLAVFGKRAAMILFPERPYRHCRFTFQGLNVLFLPSPAQLVDQDVTAMRTTFQALSSIPTDAS
jgi:hypothetical protein